MGSRRKMTEREMKATALNKKEDRVLQKTFGTLNLEMSFTYNVISLHVRTVKSNFRRLRDRVDKLKSHLTPEEITMLRQLEEEGKFKPSTTFNVNAAMKIAAAARRLNLYPEGLSRSRTAMATKRGRASDKLLAGRSQTDTNLLRKRSNSVTGAFIDAPPPDNTVRRNSTELPLKVAIRPVSAVTADQNELKITKKGVRPASTECFDREKPTMTKAAPAKPTSDISDFVSYEKTERVTEAGTGKVKRSPRDKMAMINITDESLDIGRNKLFEDRRQELLQDEHMFYVNLEKRKNNFIGKVDEYLLENPPVKFDTPIMPIILPHDAKDDEEIMAYSRRRMRKYDTDRTFTTEEEYKQREGDLWKDMNKTRYLRVPDEKIDLSGVVTLAKDQMQLYNLLKSTEPTHIISY
ncbi:uncharacterized protein LOC123566405 [Mercenaria mercenaria]|uniref:uncharacterized protein LOC123566405 n=1 Tax=Mercenaria mercenaria TaxID=6596 RepID=UPI00234F8F6E|nr:uncharacterized protein LOC123566405 [Mercenaria mercenaria]XP_045216384.2 uncharacterized protein LOC123566405 [Mercenaria mercenaria]XP_045216385.2 uncharacterized protein LOC123566405 [Mercenaria mercenaria]XP_045216386.2 uncharacterized protein LOC123566405 [Mercenaria mercenaria]XP_045216387.2 uncharacterized protein LOC123566405 [Mercenaria mercenaria]